MLRCACGADSACGSGRAVAPDRLRRRQRLRRPRLRAAAPGGRSPSRDECGDRRRLDIVRDERTISPGRRRARGLLPPAEQRQSARPRGQESRDAITTSPDRTLCDRRGDRVSPARGGSPAPRVRRANASGWRLRGRALVQCGSGPWRGDERSLARRALVQRDRPCRGMNAIVSATRRWGSTIGRSCGGETRSLSATRRAASETSCCARTEHWRSGSMRAGVGVQPTPRRLGRRPTRRRGLDCARRGCCDPPRPPRRAACLRPPSLCAVCACAPSVPVRWRVDGGPGFAVGESAGGMGLCCWRV